jgi:hypothetical protein
MNKNIIFIDNEFQFYFYKSYSILFYSILFGFKIKFIE